MKKKGMRKRKQKEIGERSKKGRQIKKVRRAQGTGVGEIPELYWH